MATYLLKPIIMIRNMLSSGFSAPRLCFKNLTLRPLALTITQEQIIHKTTPSMFGENSQQSCTLHFRPHYSSCSYRLYMAYTHKPTADAEMCSTVCNPTNSCGKLKTVLWFFITFIILLKFSFYKYNDPMHMH